MSCVKHEEAVALMMVGFYKKATFKAAEKEIQHWVEEVYKDHVILTDKIPTKISSTDQVAREFTYQSVRYVSQSKWSCWTVFLFIRKCKRMQVCRRVNGPQRREWRVISLKKEEVAIKVKQRLVEVEKSHWVQRTK